MKIDKKRLNEITPDVVCEHIHNVQPVDILFQCDLFHMFMEVIDAENLDVNMTINGLIHDFLQGYIEEKEKIKPIKKTKKIDNLKKKEETI